MLKQTSKSLLLLAALLWLPATLPAQENNTTAAVSANPAVSSEAMNAAYALFDTMGLSKNYEAMVDRITQMQLKQQPALEPIKDTMKAFFTKYMGWDSLKEEMAKIYASHFTTQELNEIKAFYETPVGKKTATLMPQLAAEGSKLGEERFKAHLEEFQKMIMDELARQAQTENTKNNP
ncbi:MAG: DUF2059 domain-containing protein [Campylobacterales bacterium]|nr:DUF2059 domain-containing protein [Campylobacterales bacterium]